MNEQKKDFKYETIGAGIMAAILVVPLAYEITFIWEGIVTFFDYYF